MKNIIIIASFAFSALIWFSCTPKVAPVIEEEVVEEVKPVEPKEDDNPCVTLDELPSATRDEVETAYVLYRDNLKMQKYDEAYKLWKKAFYGAPAANGRIKYQFEDGTKIFKHFYENAETSELKQSYVDSVLAVYNKRIECYGDPGYVAGRKAFDLYYYYREHADENEIYELFKEAIDDKRETVDYYVINPFTKLLSDRIIKKEVSIEEGSKYTKLIMHALKYGAESGKNKEAWDIINSYAPARLDNLEGIEGLYDCAYYEKKYMALYREANTDCEVINRTYSRLLYGGCDRNSAAVQELAQAKKQNCYTPPPPDGPLKKAYTAYTEGRYTESVQLFEEFVNTTSDPQKKFKYNMLIAKIYYGDIKNYPKSRQYARKAAKDNPSSGEPYLLIGKLYASSGPLCGPGTGWDSQVVTWPAIDMFKKAKSDPATAAEAQKFITTYSQYMPKKEDIFQRSIKAGSTYKVGCWIKETTTVRTAD